VGDVVAGNDHQVGVEPGQFGHPALLAHLARHQVQVRKVQDAQRLGIGRQDRHVEPTQREQVALDQRRVRERRRPGDHQTTRNLGKTHAHQGTVRAHELPQGSTGNRPA
jgi:hypothetical protein